MNLNDDIFKSENYEEVTQLSGQGEETVIVLVSLFPEVPDV
jgi:hypothetical protein